MTAVKQANADLEQARRIVELGLDLYAGDDNLVLPFVELGGRGGVCVHTHVVGPQVEELMRRVREGDLEGARQIDEELRAGLRADRGRHRPDPIKAALNLLGHEVGGVRLPLVEASEERGRADPRLPRAAAAARAGASLDRGGRGGTRPPPPAAQVRGARPSESSDVVSAVET